MSDPADTPLNQAQKPAGEFLRDALHDMHFWKNRTGDRFLATCSCGWARTGPATDELLIRGLAASHDIEWVEVLNQERVAP